MLYSMILVLQNRPQPASFYSTLMLGSISLIAFLSFRNMSLASRTRDITDKLRTTTEEESAWESELVYELKFFIDRYKLNNFALMVSCLCAFFFGVAFGFPAIQDHDWMNQAWYSDISSEGLILGGIAGTIATLVSIWETAKGRHSLFTHLACVIIHRNFVCCSKRLIRNIESIEKSICRTVDEDTCGRLKNRMTFLRDRCNQNCRHPDYIDDFVEDKTWVARWRGRFSNWRRHGE